MANFRSLVCKLGNKIHNKILKLRKRNKRKLNNNLKNSKRIRTKYKNRIMKTIKMQMIKKKASKTFDY